jgi:hypothetical protein
MKKRMEEPEKRAKGKKNKGKVLFKQKFKINETMRM